MEWSPDVPRYKIGEDEIPPVSFADDNLTFFKGDEIDLILTTLEKITQLEKYLE